MATTGSISVLQARALKMKQRAKADKKAKKLVRSKRPATIQAPAPASEEQVSSSDEEERGEGEEEGDARQTGLESDPESRPKSPAQDFTPITAAAPSAPTTFESLALIPPLLEALKQVGYIKPTDIQAGIIPHALEGKDVIGVAETVSIPVLLVMSINRCNLCYVGFRKDRRVCVTNLTKIMGRAPRAVCLCTCANEVCT
jgi:hypothetical protein